MIKAPVFFREIGAFAFQVFRLYRQQKNSILGSGCLLDDSDINYRNGSDKL